MSIKTIECNENITAYCACWEFNSTKSYSYYNPNISDNVLQKAISDIFLYVKRNYIIIYTHNLDFDGLLLLDALSKSQNWPKSDDSGYIIKFLTLDQSIYYLKVEESLSGRTIEFRCSYKMWPIQLDDIEKSWSLPIKKKFPLSFISKLTLFWDNYLPHQYQKKYFEFNKFNTKKEAILLSFHECDLIIYLLDTLSKILKEFGMTLNQKKYSISSLSLHIFFKKFNKYNITKKFIPNLDSYCREAYYGGRCEVFGNPYEDEYIFYYDFPGMYGLCMLENFPNGKYEFIPHFANTECLKPGFYNISWKSTNFNIPVLPHHNVLNGKLLFTNGFGTNTYWFEEIELFRELGGEFEINHGVVFEKFEPVFSEYVNYFYDLRKKDSPHKTFSKMLTNTLYGRLGLNDDNQYSEIVYDEDEVQDLIKYNEILSIRKLNTVWIVTFKNSENSGLKKRKKPDSAVQLAAAITAKARIKLYKAFIDVRNNGGRVLYCDTDSIVAAYTRNVLNEQHGSVFWDGSKTDTFIKKAVFALPKTYSLVNNSFEETKIKGVGAPILSFKRFEEEFYSSGSLFFKEQFLYSKKDWVLRKKMQSKSIFLNTYDKRKFSYDKKTTLPLKHCDGLYR